MEPVWRDRGFRWFTNDAGNRRLLIGDRLLRMIIDPTFERVAKPGALLEVFRNHGSADFGIVGQEVEPIRPEYCGRTARLAVVDRQGVERVWLFPTLGVVAEKADEWRPGLHMGELSRLQSRARRGLGL
jgi:hypothetical protein